MGCHPKMVTPGAGPPFAPLLATPLLLGFLCFFTFLLAFLGFTAFSLSFSINSSKNAESCRTLLCHANLFRIEWNHYESVQNLTENIYIYDVIVVGSVYLLSFEVDSYYIRSEFVLHSKSPRRMSPNQAELAFRPNRSDSCSFGLSVTGVLARLKSNRPKISNCITICNRCKNSYRVINVDLRFSKSFVLLLNIIYIVTNCNLKYVWVSS